MKCLIAVKHRPETRNTLQQMEQDSQNQYPLPKFRLEGAKFVCPMNKHTPESFRSKDLSEKRCQYRQRLDQLLKSPLTGWDRIFIRDLDRQWKICNRDGKVFKLSAKQSVNLLRIEKEVC